MANPRNFLLNSDYPIDKVIFVRSGSFYYTAGSWSVDITHNLGFIPLPYVQWSLDADFSTVQETTEKPSGLNPYSFPHEMVYSADNTKITLIFYNQDLVATTYYYRIIAFMPSNINALIPEIAIDADKLTLDTDYNYTKLITSGINTTGEVTHNLGYTPQVLWWGERANKIETPMNYGASSYFAGTTPSVTTTKVIFPDTTTYKYHYRIYADSQ